MKIKLQLGVLIFIFLISSYLIYNYVGVKDDSSNVIELITEDEKKFKKEYEELNGKYDENTNTTTMEINILEDNNIKYATDKEIIELLESGTGVIYFGFPSCPWCRNIVSVLTTVAVDYDINIYYYNAYDIRDSKHLENGNIVIDKEGTAEYNKILELLGDNASIYEGLEDDKIKRLYFPTVVFVKNGKIVDTHVGTVDTQDNPFISLTTKEKEKLEKIYIDGINKVYDIFCDESC